MKLANVSPGSCFACKTSSGPDLAAKQTAFENLFLGQISSAQTTHLHSAVKTVNASSLTSAHDHTKAAGIAFAVIHAKKELPVAFLQAALLGSGPVYQAKTDRKVVPSHNFEKTSSCQVNPADCLLLFSAFFPSRCIGNRVKKFFKYYGDRPLFHGQNASAQWLTQNGTFRPEQKRNVSKREGELPLFAVLPSDLFEPFFHCLRPSRSLPGAAKSPAGCTQTSAYSRL